jgi:hypothetical protein
VGLAFGAALAQRFKLAFVGLGDGNGEAVREQVIARVTGGDFYLVGFTAKANDVAGENNFGLHKKRNA